MAPNNASSKRGGLNAVAMIMSFHSVLSMFWSVLIEGRKETMLSPNGS